MKMKVDSNDPSLLLYNILKSQGLEFFVSVPCSLLAELIKLVENDNNITYTPVTREEEGLGILTGAYLCGKKPVIIMQNSGLGNCINAITSLVNFYKIQIIFLISHRGSEGEKIDAQKPMGIITKELLELTGIKCFEICNIKELNILGKEISAMSTNGKSKAFLFPFSYWNKEK